MGTLQVAILGGGIGALTAAFELTEHDPDRTLYEITVYQVGWRLGGKGAVGWNRGAGHHRAEEHGLHVWAGFYENAFGVLDRVYETLGEKAPFQSRSEAFLAVDHFTVMEQIGGKAVPWVLQADPLELQTNDDRSLPIAMWQKLLSRTATIYMTSGLRDHVPEQTLRSLRQRSISAIEEFGDLAVPLRHDASPLHLAASLAQTLSAEPSPVNKKQKKAIGRLLGLAREEVADNRFHASKTRPSQNADDNDQRHAWILVDLGVALARGMLFDNVIVEGFDHIDSQDWCSWMRGHECSPASLDSALVQGVYDYVFAGREPGVGAGTGTRALMRLLFAHNGSVFYTMQASLGEIVFAPLYELLNSRGVKFEFFNRVKNLKVSGDLLTEIDVEIQAHIVQPNLGTKKRYDPLTIEGGLPSWPLHPDYGQLEESTNKTFCDADLESAWTDWTDDKCEPLCLLHGRDFDIAILGIGIGALPDICHEWLEGRPQWKNMVDNVCTASTMAMQLWLKDPLAELTGRADRQTVATAFLGPLNTWADNSPLLVHELWASEEDHPQGLAYFCGNFPEQGMPPPAGSNMAYVATEKARVKQEAIDWIANNLLSLWPNSGNGSGTFDWNRLADPRAQQNGPDRLDAQLVQANINPSDRYVLSVPNSVQCRLPADGSGIQNLYLAGDWVRTGLNAGCFEAAVMAGRQAARAVTGVDMRIPGERDLAGLSGGGIGDAIIPILPVVSLLRNLTRGAAAGSGSVDACCAIMPLSRTFVKSILPPGLTIPDKPPAPPIGLVDPNKWPVAFAFCRHSRVRPGFAPFGGIRYLEFFQSIPFVQHTDEVQPAASFNYLPHLLLDEIAAVLIGVGMYGFKKRFAKIRAHGNSFEIQSDLGRIDAKFDQESMPGRIDDFYALDNIRQAFELWQISQSSSGNWIYSNLDLRFGAATFQGISGSVRIGPPFVEQSDTYTFDPIPEKTTWDGYSPVAFRIMTNWELSLPIVSAESDQSPTPSNVRAFANAWASRLNWLRR